MIVFHEGLPGAGKSFEAIVHHILPALAQGRRVVTNIEGINHARFAELLNLSIDKVQDQLRCIYTPDIEEQKQAFLDNSGKDALIVIDEIQNLFPSDRSKLSEQWNKYISEHRHEGLDILLMGQDRRDCHNMWRRRIQRVVVFLKLSAVGQDNRYKWEVHEATRPEKYKLVTSGTRTYEKIYFSLYSSHTVGTENVDNYKDKRAIIFKSKGFQYGLPVFICVFFYAIYHLSGFFTPAEVQASTPPVAKQSKQLPSQANNVRYNSRPKKVVPPPKPEFKPLDVFDDYANKNRLRFSAYISGIHNGTKKSLGYIDVLNKSYHKQDRFEISEIVALGWTVTNERYGLLIKKGDRHYVARPWPIDKNGMVDRDTRGQLKSNL